MKNIDEIKGFFMMCFVGFTMFFVSCAQDQQMPHLNTSHNNNNYEDNAPKTRVGIDEVVKFSFSGNNVRTISLDQTQVTDSKGREYQKPQLKWNVGDKYRFFATVRYVNASNDKDWKPNFSNDGMYIEITKVNADGRSGEFRIRGEINIKDEYIHGADTKNPTLTPNPENWYIGGFIGGKLDPTGTTITDDLGVEPIYSSENGKQVGVKGIRMKENKFVAVESTAKSFEMNIPLAVPLTKMTIQNYGSRINVVIPDDSHLKLEPLGTVFCLQLKNGLINSVAIPKNGSNIEIDSKFLTSSRLQFDTWHKASELGKVGTPEFSVHYVYENNVEPTTYGGLTKVSLPVDWSQCAGRTKGDDVVLNMDECVNLYLWSVWNDFYGSNPNNNNSITMDFSGLGLKTPTYSGDAGSPVVFKPMNTAKVTYYGGVDATTRDKWRNQYFNKDVNFLKSTINSSGPSLRKGSTVFSRFTISSEMFISEVYFDWRNENNGLVEIFNPNSTDVDLSDYYLMRMEYSDGTQRFVGPFGTRTDRMQCGLLLPLNLNNTIEFTPGTSDKTKIHYHKIVGTTHTEEEDRGNPYNSSSLLYAPHTENKGFRITKLGKGMTMCIAGHGVYNLIETNENNRNPDLKLGLFKDGILGADDMLSVLKSYITTDYNKTPQHLGYIWGVIDGELSKNSNASADDMGAGVTARSASQGYALVKKIDGKYYVIDTFGPTWITDNGQITVKGFKDLMSIYETKYNKNFDMVRKDHVVFPNGGRNIGKSMDENWNCQYLGESDFVSIGARSRYDKATGRGKTIPYFFGAGGN